MRISVVLIALLSVVATLPAQDSLNVRRVGQITDFNLEMVDLSLRWPYALVAAGTGGLRTIRVDDPAAPVDSSLFSLGGYSRDVTWLGNNGYVATETGGVNVINVFQPRHPALRGSYSHPELNAYALVVETALAYVVNVGQGLWILNIINPQAPLFESEYDSPGQAGGLDKSGDYVFLADGIEGLQVVDVSDYTNPVSAGGVNTNGDATEVDIAGDFAYVADGPNGLVIVDISTPTSPVVSGSYQGEITDAIDVFVLGDHAFVASGAAGFFVINVQNPAQPYLVGYYNTPGLCSGIAAQGGYAYAADGHYFGVYDVSQALPVSEPAPAPRAFALHDAYPNPFNASTTIEFSLPMQADASLEVFNLLGERVAVLLNESAQSGSHSVFFGGSDLASGVYLYQLRAGDFSETRKFVLMK